MADRTFLLKIVGDVSNASKSLGTLESDVSSMKKGMSDTAKIVAGAFAVDAVVDFGKAIATSASDQEQAIGAVDSVFKDYADTIHSFGETSAENLGIARGEFEQLASLTGALLKNAGVPLEEVAKATTDLTTVGADLAAMYGGTVPDAMGAINSALKGEMDPLEQFGVSLKASAIEAKAVAMGLVDAEGKATDYGKKMATVALIQEQSADAAGTFAKESKSMAGQTQIMSARFKDLQADLGQKLLPTIVQVAGILTSLIGFVIANQDWLLPLAAGIGAVVVAMKAWSLATQVWTFITEAASAVQLAFNAVMAMNPIGLVVIALAALVAGLILAYKKVDWFREFVDAAMAGIVDAFEWVVDAARKVYDWIKQNWPLLLAIITGPFGLAVYAIARNWDTIRDGVRNLIDAITGFFRGIPDKIRDAIGSIWNAIAQVFWTARDNAIRAFDPLLNFFQNLRNRISDAFYDLADVIAYPFKEAFRAIKNLWNSTVGGFGFSVPGWIPGVGGRSFSIPRMAKGGIVTGPTIAMIGEAGREAVIPLDKAGGFGNVVINVYALTASAEVGRQVWNALREYERTSGRSLTNDNASTLSIFAA